MANVKKFYKTITLKDDSQVEAKVSFYHTPGEPSTWDYPGCDAQIDDIELTGPDGVDLTNEVDDVEYERIRAEAWAWLEEDNYQNGRRKSSCRKHTWSYRHRRQGCFGSLS